MTLVRFGLGFVCLGITAPTFGIAPRANPGISPMKCWKAGLMV